MASGTSEPLAIYRRPGRYILRSYRQGEPGLWAILGSEYTRETAHALADSLTQELKERRPARSQHGRAE